MTAAMRRFIEQRLLTTQEASALCGLSTIALQKRVERGKLAAVLKGRTYLFDRQDIEGMARKATTK